MNKMAIQFNIKRSMQAFITAVVALVLAGCESQEAKQQAKQELLQRLEKAGGTGDYVSPLPDNAPILKVATTGTQPPFSFQDEYGNMIGIDIDAIRLIGEKAGFKVEFYQEMWQNVFPSVVAGKRDLAISGISYSDERNKNYSLSSPYLYVPSAIMYKDESLNIKGLSDLKGRRFGGMRDAKQINDVRSSGTPNVTIVPENTVFLAYEKMIRGEVDAIAEDIQWLEYIAKKHPEHKVFIVPYEDESFPVANQVIMLKKGNQELLNKINAAIAELKKTDEFNKIEKKWKDQYASN